MASSAKAAKIRKLDETVINRIAAGEVIQRPANALKELLENSLDAGASSIQITVKAGGLKLLQIQDDGSGINKEDLDIVCERFTTSKLEKFEDLEEISTYGFRGEALASISHVAHLTIITKTGDSVCAFRAEYIDGKLKVLPGNAPNPKPCAGNKGTIIMVEDLFYNMETRRRALKSASEEHNRIVDAVGRYAIHNSKVGFSVKKQGEGNVDLRTPPNSSATDNIKVIYGPLIARELLELQYEDEHFKMKGHISNVNYSTKKFTFLLFINHRLVESSAIKKAVDSVYTSYLPKGSHPFLYLSIEINPRNVDVNVHPTKSEVHFLHEDIIITRIANTIETQLLGSNQSRTYYVQTMLPGAAATDKDNTTFSSTQKSGSKESSAKIDRLNFSAGSVSAVPRDPRNLVRTDTKLQKLDKFFASTPSSSQTKVSFGGEDSTSMIDDGVDRDSGTLSSSTDEVIPRDRSTVSHDTSVKRREIRLKSVKNLMETVQLHCHKGLEELFRSFTFVGCVDRTRALLQHETKLYMVNTARVSMELFYQKMLWEFGNFGRINLTEPVTVEELASIGVESEEANNSTKSTDRRSSRVEKIKKVLLGKAEMLDDYFGLKIDRDGKLRTIPLLLENYFPCMESLPSYILNLAEKVDWSMEQECFETFAHQTAIFYSVQPGGSSENDELTHNNKSWKWTIEYVVYPEIKKCLLPPQTFTKDSTVVQLANLPDLYKVFERC